MRLLLLLAVVCGAASASARAAKARPPAPAPPAPATAPAPVTTAGVSTAQLLLDARAAIEGLEYAQALVLAEALVKRDDASSAARVDGYWMMAVATAVLRDPLEAEPALRTLFRLNPSYEPPADPGPKILAAFRKVQVEERTLAERLAATERARLIEGISLTGSPPQQLRGGRAAVFSFRLKDPTGAVDQLSVNYRLKSAGGPFSSLALLRAEDGQWTGDVPGELTANLNGDQLEYFVEGVDEKGPLLSRGEARLPLAIELSPGEVKRGLPRRALYVSLAVSLVAAAVSAGLGVAALVAERTHAGLWGEVSSRDWNSSFVTAHRLIDATWVSLIVTAVSTCVSVVLSKLVEAPD